MSFGATGCYVSPVDAASTITCSEDSQEDLPAKQQNLCLLLTQRYCDNVAFASVTQPPQHLARLSLPLLL